MNNADKPAYPIGQKMFEELEMGRNCLDEGYGLTKRERFAMAAMQGWIACQHEGFSSAEPFEELIADRAIKCADALLRKLDNGET